MSPSATRAFSPRSPLLSHPHLPISLPSPPLLLSLPEGGSADSYILGRSRGFLPMSKSPAGLWPPPDGQGQWFTPWSPLCTQTCDKHRQVLRRRQGWLGRQARLYCGSTDICPWGGAPWWIWFVVMGYILYIKCSRLYLSIKLLKIALVAAWKLVKSVQEMGKWLFSRLGPLGLLVGGAGPTS